MDEGSGVIFSPLVEVSGKEDAGGLSFLVVLSLENSESVLACSLVEDFVEVVFLLLEAGKVEVVSLVEAGRGVAFSLADAVGGMVFSLVWTSNVEIVSLVEAVVSSLVESRGDLVVLLVKTNGVVLY